MASIKMTELREAIDDLLMEYGDSISRDIEVAAEDSLRFGRSRVAERSPKSSYGGPLGHYADGWEYELVKRTNTVSGEIYQKNKPGLVHLLEKGHAKRGGDGRVQGIRHVGPTQNELNDHFLREVEKRLK